MIILRISVYDIITAKPKASRPALCELEADSGPCTAAKQGYYFNKKSGHCEVFTYGGCQGNENNFETKRECEKTCQGKFHLLSWYIRNYFVLVDSYPFEHK